MPGKVGTQVVPEKTVALAERLDRGGRAAVDAMFRRVERELVVFRHGPEIVTLLQRVLASPVYAGASADVAWSTFVGRLNDELFEDRLLTEDESHAFWHALFGGEGD